MQGDISFLSSCVWGGPRAPGEGVGPACRTPQALCFWAPHLLSVGPAGPHLPPPERAHRPVLRPWLPRRALTQRSAELRLTVGAGPACEHFPAQSEPGSCGAEGPGGGASAPAPFHPPSSPPCQHCAVSENERCQTQAQGKRHICPRNTNASKGGGRGERFQKENVPGKCLNPESLLHRRVSAPKTRPCV